MYTALEDSCCEKTTLGLLVIILTIIHNKHGSKLGHFIYCYVKCIIALATYQPGGAYERDVEQRSPEVHVCVHSIKCALSSLHVFSY